MFNKLARWWGKVLICKVCQFPRCKYSHHGLFQTVNVTSTESLESWRFNGQFSRGGSRCPGWDQLEEDNFQGNKSNVCLLSCVFEGQCLKTGAQSQKQPQTPLTWPWEHKHEALNTRQRLPWEPPHNTEVATKRKSLCSCRSTQTSLPFQIAIGSLRWRRVESSRVILLVCNLCHCF